ncbi:MAG TPA: DUF1684 domain-containing protein [Candidatus Polarisedimenticolaceae bacterium]|nr:DUF1684 domain-containing protein [Candidatus Polarisedimenticolaceae bacterium]
MLRFLSWLSLATVILAAAFPAAVAAEPDTYPEEIDAYRRARLERLTAPDGWLSLIGLHWLEPGKNAVGSDPALAVVLPADVSPPRAGELILADAVVRFVPEPDAAVTLGGAAVPDRPLRDDVTGEPDVLELGRLRMHLIRRGDRFALRVKDPASPARTGFLGIDYFALDRAFRVEARFVPFDEPETIEVPTVTGGTTRMSIPGRLTFELAGRPLSLDPLVSGPDDDEWFLIFRDGTSGRESYGAGRYLYVPITSGPVVIDFNKAYNPPCVFTPYATCPLPPAANRLAVEIRAGEKTYRGH